MACSAAKHVTASTKPSVIISTVLAHVPLDGSGKLATNLAIRTSMAATVRGVAVA